MYTKQTQISPSSVSDTTKPLSKWLGKTKPEGETPAPEPFILNRSVPISRHG
jgi:hypothetical protein